MISHLQKFVFIHIAKNAGTSIEHGLLSAGAEVDNFKFGPEVHYDVISEDMAKNYFIFAIHRNPWDRMVSLWQYWIFTSPLLKSYNLSDDFAFFCKNINYIKSLLPELEHAHFLPQTAINNQPSYVRPEWFDFINLEKNFEYICKRIGLPYKSILKYNFTNHQHYTVYYDNDLINLVYQQYKEDIKYFKYEYGTKI